MTDPQTQDLIYGLRDRSECAFNRSHPQCRSEKPAQPARWCDGCQQGGAADALEAQAAEIARLNRVLEITNRHIEQILPCPDCRDKVKQGECERCRRQKAEERAERAEAEVSTLRAKLAEAERREAELREKMSMPYAIGVDWGKGESWTVRPPEAEPHE